MLIARHLHLPPGPFPSLDPRDSSCCNSDPFLFLSRDPVSSMFTSPSPRSLFPPQVSPFCSSLNRVENHHDQNPLRVLRYVEAFKCSDKEDGQEELSEKQPSVAEGGTLARASLVLQTPSLSRTTSQSSSSHRGWEILRRNTLAHLNLGLDLGEGDGEEVYHF